MIFLNIKLMEKGHVKKAEEQTFARLQYEKTITGNTAWRTLLQLPISQRIVRLPRSLETRSVFGRLPRERMMTRLADFPAGSSMGFFADARRTSAGVLSTISSHLTPEEKTVANLRADGIISLPQFNRIPSERRRYLNEDQYPQIISMLYARVVTAEQFITMTQDEFDTVFDQPRSLSRSI